MDQDQGFALSSVGKLRKLNLPEVNAEGRPGWNGQDELAQDEETH